MAVKNIAITEEAYSLLKRQKLPGESFSEVIVENFKKKKNLIDFAGIWSDMPESELKALKRRVEQARKGIGKGIRRSIEAFSR